MNVLKTMVSDLIRLNDDVYSNFDHVLDIDVVNQLKQGGYFSAHVAWDFVGYVYFYENKWHEEIWVYGIPMETLSGDSIKDVANKANKKYGSR